MIKRFYSRGVLQAAKGLPVVGKYLLQRNAIKIGIPLVGVPLSVVVNRYTTLIAGKHARAVFRNEARVIELAERLCERSRHPHSMLWIAWLVINADPGISDDEALLFRHLVAIAERRYQIVDDELAQLIDLKVDDVWRRLDAEDGDLSDVLDLATTVAKVDGDPTKKERVLLIEIAKRCARGRDNFQG
ncbi:hypothetical protein IFT73_01320 [Aeromicrobium sp. CFBP 8757]|nr:hypothetical protein [Aeromicrobium sp. CFBP 8757]